MLAIEAEIVNLKGGSERRFVRQGRLLSFKTLLLSNLPIFSFTTHLCSTLEDAT